VSREIINSDHLSTLISGYQVHFAAYSSRRIKAVTQLIPGTVWKAMYKDYLEQYPDSSFKESNLKERVRETLNELETGNSNPKRTSSVALQSADVLKKIRLTNGHASRNVLKYREKLMNDGLPDALTTSGRTSTTASTTLSAALAPAGTPYSTLPTTLGNLKAADDVVALGSRGNASTLSKKKVSMMEQQTRSIAAIISTTFATTNHARDAYMERKEKHMKEQADLKKTSSKMNDFLTTEKFWSTRLENLKKMKEMDMLTDEQFKAEKQNIAAAMERLAQEVNGAYKGHDQRIVDITGEEDGDTGCSNNIQNEDGSDGSTTTS
jgi:uncharacterized protein YifE (UPF0438 family)